MKPDVYEHNLRLLLGRSWQRIEPDPGFAQRLERACAERVASRRPRSSAPAELPQRRFRLVPLAAALAAAAAVLLLARPLWRADSPAVAPTLESILAAGDIALRPAAGGDWRGVAPGSSLVAGEATLAELPLTAEPDIAASGAGLSIGWEQPAARAEVEPGARARFGMGDGFALLDGHAEITAGSMDFPVGTGSIELLAKNARLRASAKPDLASASVTVRSGSVRLRGGPTLPPRDEAYRFQNGVLAGPFVGAAEPPTTTDPGRVAIGGPDEVAEPDGPATAPDKALLRVRPRGADGQDLAACRVWLRRQVNLPEVAEALPFELEAQDPPLEVDPGRYTIAIDVPAFAPVLLRDVELSLGDNPELIVPLDAGRPITGYVVDADTGAPVQDALVVIENRLPHEVIHAQGFEFEPVPYASARTDAAGRWEIAHAPAGRLTLRAISGQHAPGRLEDFRAAPAEPSRTAQKVPHFELLPGATLVGTVEQLDGSPWRGTPVIASRIRVEGGDAPMTYGYAETGPDGSFRIRDLPDGNYVVLLPAEAASGRLPRIRHARLAGTATQTVHFPGAVDPAAGVRVRLAVRLGDGQPAASKNLTITSDSSGEWHSTITDADGVGELVGITPGSYEVALALAEGYDSMVFGTHIEVRSDPDQTFEIAAGTVRLSGVVAGITGGFVYVQRQEQGSWVGAGSAQIGRDGGWEIVGLQPGRLRGGLFGRDATEGYAPIPAFDLLDDPQRMLELTPAPGAQLEVTVRDGQGAPVPGAEIVLYDPGRVPLLFSQVSATDSKGTMPVPIVPSGTWTVLARAADGRRASAERFFAAGESVKIELVLE